MKTSKREKMDEIRQGKARMTFTVLSILVAAILWALMFSPATAPYFNFWTAMAVSSVILATLSFISGSCDRSVLQIRKSDILYGILSAALLWGIFWVGDKLSSMLFDFARPQVDSIYGMKSGMHPVLLSALPLLLTGPAEEIFWRGFIQRSLSERYGANAGFVIATAIYALVHVPSLNFMLTMAAFVAGIFWGLLYRLFPDRLGTIIISHALWDAAVFVWIPIL